MDENTTLDTSTAARRAIANATSQPTNENTSPISPRMAESTMQKRMVPNASRSKVVMAMPCAYFWLFLF